MPAHASLRRSYRGCLAYEYSVERTAMNPQEGADRSERSPRLLIVVNVPWFFVMHRLPIAVMARSRGVDVHIACGDGAGHEDIEAAGFPFHRLPLTRKPFAP